jgi:hypothetical protein
VKTPEEIVREIRDDIDCVDFNDPITPDDLRRWADGIEASMREPVAEYVALPDGLEWRFRPQIFDPPVGTKLFAFPPDAEEEIRYLRSRLADATKANDLFQTAADAEIERLREENTRLRSLVEFEPDLEAALAKEDKP